MEDSYVIKNELSVLSKREDELKAELEKANERIEQLKIEKKQCSAMLGQETQLVIDSLQEELVAVKVIILKIFSFDKLGFILIFHLFFF